ncbi:VWA domain-containing protein [Bacillus sp. NTK034]|uniref:VWA domain-containing protein n=1 Tax=Bacillus sp. NTK034 TaxID=2802176 RepID=UPI001A8DCF08|nr:VWA domain-containing protein [Bacillus sp. NTK034]MBN8200731.1 VWA domain-containing protein [Bacillus sp. NTK034]
MAKKILLSLLTVLIICFLSAQSSMASGLNDAKLNFTVQPSQNIIVKPADRPAAANLDFRVKQSGSASDSNREPMDVVFIMDISGSMNDAGKLDSAKTAMNNALDHFLQTANSADRYFLIPFNKKISEQEGFFYPSGNALNDLGMIKEKVRTLTAINGTNYKDPIKKAEELLKGGNGNNNIVFLTDGVPTYSESIQIRTFNKKSCVFIFCDSNRVTEEVTYIEELLTRGYTKNGIFYPYIPYQYLADEYFIDNNNRSYSIKNNSEHYASTQTSIRKAIIDEVKKLTASNIKLHSIGFGSDDDIDMNFLNEMSYYTGETAIQAGTGNIEDILERISSSVLKPSITAEIQVDLNPFKGKVTLAEGANAIQNADNIITKKVNFKYDIGKETISELDFSIPLNFAQEGKYVFKDNIKLKYKDLNNKEHVIVHPEVQIEVQDDAPASFNGTMLLEKELNDLRDLVKEMSSDKKSNQFNIKYNLEPIGIPDNRVEGSLRNIIIKQPLPEGILIADPSVKEEIINGQRHAVLTLTNQQSSYKNGAFTPNRLSAKIALKADRAFYGLTMPRSQVFYSDSRFPDKPQSTSIAASSQVIDAKVRLNSFNNIAYDGDAAGIISKLDLNNNGKKLAQSEFPNNYGLKNKPVKNLYFLSDSKAAGLKIEYTDDSLAQLYFEPDFEMNGEVTGNVFSDKGVAYEPIAINLSKLVAGKDVNYFYKVEKDGNEGIWNPFAPEGSVLLDAPGSYIIKVKASGGFAFGNEISKSITIVKRIESISVAPDPIELDVDKSKSFKVEISPSDASNQELEMIIEDTSKADFVDDNTILGKSAGETYLVVKAKDGSNIERKIKIIVTDHYIALEEIKFDKAVYKIDKDDSIAVKNLLIFNPSNATDQDIVEVLSEMPDKVRIVQRGAEWYIEGVAIGYSKVTAAAEEQKDGKQPKASALFEVVNEADQTDNGPAGEGKW